MESSTEMHPYHVTIKQYYYEDLESVADPVFTDQCSDLVCFFIPQSE
jgi:hypothetical protein